MILLAIVQGFAELLPVSSSAHVVVAEKLMGINPSAPETTLLLVMLHTGTMFAVIVYFWRRWRATATWRFASLVVFATVITGIVGEALLKPIERRMEVEQLFSHLEFIAPALAAAGVVILIAGLVEKRSVSSPELNAKHAALIGAVQGLCLPFRGFSRSGATISVGMLARVSKEQAENFSFALAVVLTPSVVAREGLRLLKSGPQANLGSTLGLSAFGAVCAFGAGLLALRWLSQWLESGRWYLFGIYCLLASAVVGTLYFVGY